MARNINKKYLSLDRTRKDLSGFTNSCCSLACKNCSLFNWRKSDPNYHWALEDVEKFVYYTKKSGYKFDSFTIAGGEPFLWKNLKEGIKIIKEGKIAKLFAMESNGIGQGGISGTIEQVGQTLEYVDRIRFSIYSKNKEYIKELNKEFKSDNPMKGAHFVDRVIHRVPPTKRYPGTLPAPCRCPNYKVKGDEVQICPAVSEIICRFGWNRNDFNKYFEKLKVGYLERLNQINKLIQPHCEYCLVNNKIWPKLRKSVND